MRKSWMKPKLIVLVRGTSDERVLTGCKTLYAGSLAGTPEQTGCQYNKDLCGNCSVPGTK
jgi:hypothetical protein